LLFFAVLWGCETLCSVGLVMKRPVVHVSASVLWLPDVALRKWKIATALKFHSDVVIMFWEGIQASDFFKAGRK
jgi:hypothetical protein